MNLNDGLISYWTMDETSGVRGDSTGRYPLTPSNSPGYTAGINGNAVSFDANSNQGLVGSGFKYLTTFTITGWFKFSDPTNTNPRILITVDGAGATNQSNGWNFYLFAFSHNYNGTGRLEIDIDTTNDENVYRNDYMFDGNWHFFCVTCDSINNVLSLQYDSNTPQTTNIQSSFYGATQPGDLVIGYDPIYDPNDCFNGAMDEVGIWNRVLTTDEISQLRNKVRPTTAQTSILAKKRFILHTHNNDKMILQNYAAIAEMAKSLLTEGQLGSKDKAKKLLAAQVNQQYFKAESGSVHNKRVVNFR